MQIIHRLKSLAAVAALFLGATALPALAQDNAGLCPAGYKEAPQLKAMVDAGTLPGGFGLNEGTAVLYEGDRAGDFVTERAGSVVYRVDTHLPDEPMPTRAL